MSDSTIRWEQDADGVVVLTLDDPSSSANTMNDAYVRSMGETIDRLEREKASIRGVVLTSAKKTFFAGGNLGSLIQATPDTRDDVLAQVTLVKSQLRRSTAPPSAAAWRSRWPAITASSSTTRR
jgi:3-hydroxyacyl-CoA dehydrogenase/enoyl-CoA hydratase/3-hydroxybutyryl-CoA epimerase